MRSRCNHRARAHPGTGCILVWGAPMRISQDERLFNVDINGLRIASAVTRNSADDISARYRGGLNFIQIWLASKEPPNERRAAWYKKPLPRMPSLRTTENSRAEAMAKVLADRDITYEEAAE